MGSATDLNSRVPTQVEANRGVNTMWLRGETQTMSYTLGSNPFRSLHPAHPEPSTTTRGFSWALVGSRPEYSTMGLTPGFSSTGLVLKWERKVNENGCVFLGVRVDEDAFIMVENLVERFLNQAMNVC